MRAWLVDRAPWALLLVAGVVLMYGSWRLHKWWYFEEDNARLKALEAEVAELKKYRSVENSNFDLLFEADNAISAELLATRARADLAHDRITYYRDALLIVAKTCPGRMKLPGWDLEERDPGKQ